MADELLVVVGGDDAAGGGAGITGMLSPGAHGTAVVLIPVYDSEEENGDMEAPAEDQDEEVLVSSTSTTSDPPPLVAHTSCCIPVACKLCLTRICSSITIEPYVFLFHLMYIGYFTLTQQYLLWRFTGEHNVNTHTHQSDLSGTDQCATNMSVLLQGDNLYTPAHQALLHNHFTSIGSGERTSSDTAQAKTSLYLLLLDLTLYLLSFPTTIYLGATIRKWGCKNVLILPTVGCFIRTLIYMLVVSYDWSLWLLFVANAVEGLSGSMTTVMTAWGTYIMFVAEPQHKAFRLAATEVCVYMGLVVGSLILGNMQPRIGYGYTYMYMLAILLLTLLYLMFRVKDVRDETSASCTLRVKLTHTLRLFFCPSDYRWTLLINTTIIMLSILCLHGLTNVSVLYAVDSPFCLTSAGIGYLTAATLLSNNIGTMSIIKLGYKTLGEIGIIIVSSVSSFFKTFILSISRSWLWLYIDLVPGVFQQAINPMTRTLCSNAVSSDDQGPLFAGISIVCQVATLLGSLLFNSIYTWSVSFAPSLAFSVAAMMAAIMLALAIIQLKKL